MTREERILAAINLEPYDRVPVSPLITPSFPLRHQRKHTADVYNPNLAEEALQAIEKLFDEVGGWDAYMGGRALLPLPPESSLYHSLRGYTGTFVYPGTDGRLSVDSEIQFAEREVITAEDYDEIIEVGWREFLEKKADQFTGSTSPPLDTRVTQAKKLIERFFRDRDRLQKQGVPLLFGGGTMDPQMALSLMRTLRQFTLDLYRRPDKVQAVLDNWVEEYAEDILEALRPAGIPPIGIPGILMACERGSGSHYNLKIFERFVWPYIKRLVEVWTDAGYIVILHFDTDWTRNLPYLLELPPKKCICELDGTTDIFKAKEILKDHMCIMGDVPAPLSAYGTPEEMEEYCKKLIDVVGKDTGFILSSACTVPPDCKYENFKAMIDTAKNYYPHG